MNHSVADISKRLSDQAELVCRHLLPGGKIQRGEWVAGDVTGAPGDSLVVNLEGEHKGKWRDWANDADRGDLIDLWACCKGIPMPSALQEVKQFLGISEPIEPHTKKTYVRPKSNERIRDLNPEGKAMTYLTAERKLTAAIVNRYKVRGDGENIVFPSYSPSGELINNSYVALKRDESGKKKVFQDKGCAPCLWGWHGLSDTAFASRTVLLCEGQIDCMTWAQWGIDALSIPNGSGKTWIDYEWDNLQAFDTIYLSFDMDGKSDENLQGVINRLGKHRCLTVTIPEKDANDSLKVGRTAEDAELWIRNAKRPDVAGFLPAEMLKKRVYEVFYPDPSKPQGLQFPFLKSEYDDGGFAIRPAEITVWTGIAGHGKSTFLGWLMMGMASAGERIMIASMEMKPETVFARIIAAFFNKKPPTHDELEEFFRDIAPQFFFCDRVGYIEQPALFEMMRFAFQRYGATHFLIDSLMRIQGLEEDYVAQGDFMNELASFAKTTNTHVHLVCHPRKTNSDGVLSKMDIKGSSLILNNCDNVLSVQRNPEKDKIRKERQLTPQEEAMYSDTILRVEKQRDTGWEGKFELKFDRANYAFGTFRKAVTTLS